MATNEDTIRSLEACNELLKEVLRINPENLPFNVRVMMKSIEQRYGPTMKGHRYTLSLHIGQQKRQIAWADGKHLHKSTKVR
jgi:hypothetical protein